MGHEKAGVTAAVVTRMWPKDIRIAFVLVAGAVAAAPVTAQDFALGPAEIADSAPLSRAMPRLAHQVLERYPRA